LIDAAGDEVARVAFEVCPGSFGAKIMPATAAFVALRSEA